MRRAWHTLALSALIVFASATLPSHLQKELIDMLQLPERLCKTYRASTTLKYIAYRVQSLPKRLCQPNYPSYLM
jgi:hypothetical protein